MKKYVKDQCCENCRKLIVPLYTNHQYCFTSGHLTASNEWCSEWKPVESKNEQRGL